MPDNHRATRAREIVKQMGEICRNSLSKKQASERVKKEISEEISEMLPLFIPYKDLPDA